MLVAIVVFIVTMVMGLPLAFVLGLWGTVHLMSLGDPNLLGIEIQKMYGGIDVLALTCIPFFIMAGELMNAGGITKRLLDFVRDLVGWLKGGMAYSTVIVAVILSSILGSSNAVASILCSVLVPELKKDKYPEEFSGALIASASILGPIIPPSTIFVFYCMLTDVSIKYMFLAGIIPGILISAAYASIIAYKTKSYKFSNSIEKFSPISFGKSFLKALPALMVPVILGGGIISGVFTPVESGAVACVFVIILGLVYKDLKLTKLPDILFRCSMTTAAILLIIALSNTMAYSMTMDGIPQRLSEMILSFSDNTYIIMALILIVLLLVGIPIDIPASVLIFVPVMFPLAQAVGFDAVHFGIIFCIMVIIGLITPPVGMSLFVTANVSEIPLTKLSKETWPFAIAAFVVTVILAYTPNLVLFIPRLIGYGG